MLKIRILYTVLLLFAFVYLSKGITLKQVIEFAEERAAQIKISKLDIKKVEFQIKEVKSNLYPKIVFNGNYSRIDRGLNTGFIIPNQYRLSLLLTQKIFDRTVFESLKYAKQNTRLYKAIEKQVQIKVIDTAKRLYMTSLLKKEILKLKKENLNYWKKNLEFVKEQFNLGLTNRFNLLRSKTAYSNAYSEYKNAEADYKKSLIDLKSFLLLENISEPEEDYSKMSYQVKDFKYLKENNPDIKVLKERLKLAKKQIDVVKATNYPNLEFQAEYRAFNTIKFPELQEFWLKGYVLSLNLNFILYDGNQKKSKVVQSKIERSKEEVRYIDKIYQIKGEYEKTIEDLKVLEERIKTLKLNLQTAKEALNLSTERFKYGLSSIIELFDTRKSYNDTYIQYLLAVHQFNMKVLDLNLLYGEY